MQSTYLKRVNLTCFGLTLGDYVICSGSQPWRDLFLRMDIQMKGSVQKKEWTEYLQDQFLRSRFEVASMEVDFMTYAEFFEGLEVEFVKSLWAELSILGAERLMLPVGSLDYENEIRRRVQERSWSPQLVETAIGVVKRYKIYLAQHLQLGLPNGKNANELQLGSLGELLAYLVASDIEKHDCLYHKLVPDTPNAARHGVDLLTVKFGTSTEKDEVHWWEAKGTIDSFGTQRDRVISWFNEGIWTRLSTTIEAAKKEWILRYERETWKRAVVALSKFMLQACKYRFVGIMVFDKSKMPSDSMLERFGEIHGPSGDKEVVLFPLANIEQVAKELHEIRW